MSTRVPPMLARLVDDAAVFPPGNAPLPEAVAAHQGHRAAWYADLVGPLMVPASAVLSGALDAQAELDGQAELDLGIVGDGGIDPLQGAARALAQPSRLRQVEVAVAKRGEDPQPGLTRLAEVARGLPAVACFAEIPLAWGLLGALDTVARLRADGLDLSPKFRTGGLAAELFPTPVELAAVICACRDRGLRFKLTAGLHHAIRYTDPETGLVHHGFLNVLAASVLAVDGSEVAEVAEALAATHPVPLVELTRGRRGDPRPLFVGFGAANVVEPLTELVRLGLVNGGYE
jgi:hypothetical protein